MAKKNIKEEIINTARRLFNAQGYSDVSMRDIADALQISVGNLTYHYRRKEELMEAVVLDMHQYYRPFAPPTTLRQLNAFFARVQNNIQQNAFYFWHYTQLAELSPTVHDIQAQVMEQQHALLREAFANFSAAGLFVPEAREGQHARLAQAVLIVCVYWVPHSKLAQDTDAPKDFLDCVWSMLLPCLSPQGQRVYEEIQRVRVDIDALTRM